MVSVSVVTCGEERGGGEDVVEVGLTVEVEEEEEDKFLRTPPPPTNPNISFVLMCVATSVG